MFAELKWGCLALAAGGAIAAAEIPMTNVKPLSQVLKHVEGQGVAQIVEASFDDGVWEIEGFRGNQPVDLEVNPQSLAIVGEHPDSHHVRLPQGALPASALVSKLEQAGYPTVVDIDWEHGYWEVEAMSPNGFRELRVDAAGKILSDRPERD